VVPRANFNMQGPTKSASPDVATGLDLQCLQKFSELLPIEPAQTIRMQQQKLSQSHLGRLDLDLPERLAELLKPLPSSPAEALVLKPLSKMLSSAPPSDPPAAGPVMPLTPGCIHSFSLANDKHAGCSTSSTASEPGICNSMIPSPSPRNSTQMQPEQILAGRDASPLPTLLLALWKKTGDNGNVLQSLRCWDSKASRPSLGLSDPEPQRECKSSRPQHKICPAESTSISAVSGLPFDVCKRKESPLTENGMHKTSGGSHSKGDRRWRLVNRKITDPQRAADDIKCVEEPCRDAKRWHLVNRRLPGP